MFHYLVTLFCANISKNAFSSYNVDYVKNLTWVGTSKQPTGNRGNVRNGQVGPSSYPTKTGLNSLAFTPLALKATINRESGTVCLISTGSCCGRLDSGAPRDRANSE